MRLDFYALKFIKATLWLITVGLGLLSCWATNTLEAKPQSNLQALIGDRDAIFVTDPYGSIIFSKNADKRHILRSQVSIFYMATCVIGCF